GFKYNMTDIQAALGLWQLRKLPAFQERRRQVVRRYTEAFQGDEALELPVERPNVEHAWHLYVLRLRPGVLRIGRDRFIEELATCNIGTSVHFTPIHLHPYYRDKYGYQATAFAGASRGVVAPAETGWVPAAVRRPGRGHEPGGSATGRTELRRLVSRPGASCARARAGHDRRGVHSLPRRGHIVGSRARPGAKLPDGDCSRQDPDQFGVRGPCHGVERP